MAKIPRVKQEIFGKNAGSRQITAFGTAKTETPVYTTDVAAIQNDNYMYGWQPALLPDKAPYEEDMNALFYAVTSQLAYLYQEGIPEYDSNTAYSQNALVRGVGEAVIYYSLVNDNQGNPLTNPTYWAVFFSTDSFGDISQDLENLKQYVDNQITSTKSYVDTEIASLKQYVNVQIANSKPTIQFKNGGYICKLGNGVKIQWGYSNRWQQDRRYTNITYPEAFSGDDTYRVVVSGLNAGMSNDRSSWVFSQNARGCVAANAQGGIGQNWIAIGQ